MSEEKVSYKIVTENKVVIEVEPKGVEDENAKERLKMLHELLKANKGKEE